MEALQKKLVVKHPCLFWQYEISHNIQENNNLLEYWKDVVKYIDNIAEKDNRDACFCSGVDGIKVQLWEAITRYWTRISKNG